MDVLAESAWRARAAAHEARADALTAGHRERRARHEAHPVEDFLYTYYPTRPSRLRRWHPGAGVVLENAAGRADWPGYRRWSDDRPGPDDGGGPVGTAVVDVETLVEQRVETIRFVADLLTATAARPPHLGCFGLHEWAMVYRSPATRHPVPLRLGATGTDAVVETHRVRCTHFDAYRFFTDAAAPRNEVTPTRARQVDLEQPGCLHAGMDLYKWADKLGPLVPGELLLDCFTLARDIRALDMRASPYDLAAYGYAPVRIETPEGRAEYVREQRSFAERGAVLRSRLLTVLTALPAPTPVPGAGAGAGAPPA